ncbi:MAG: ZIP family metal transporter [Candidatus Cyclobacteriaceae bacterium M3_2C_046]
MWLNAIVLFFSAIVAGISVFFIPNIKEINFKLTLVFAGAYLFSITIIHIIPELFVTDLKPEVVGLYLLIGFFVQLFIELLTSGIEHGHLHHAKSPHDHSTSPLVLMIGLCFHSILEGSLLAHPSELHQHHHATGLLLGIIFHKMPAAFALMSILFHQLKNRNTAIIYLVIFALASPAGLFLSNILNNEQLISSSAVTIIFAIVSGNFLKISTTILFESSPQHHFNLSKVIVSAIGALLAVGVEFLH